MVMKRRTRAVRRQTNFIELACTAVLLVADEHGQCLVRFIVPDDLILLDPFSSLLAPSFDSAGNDRVTSTGFRLGVIIVLLCAVFFAGFDFSFFAPNF